MILLSIYAFFIMAYAIAGLYMNDFGTKILCWMFSLILFVLFVLRCFRVREVWVDRNLGGKTR